MLFCKWRQISIHFEHSKRSAWQFDWLRNRKKIMARSRKLDKAMARLIRWSEMPQWADLLEIVFESHLSYPAKLFGISDDEIYDYLDGPSSDTLVYAIIEDFFSSSFGEDGELNVVNDYLGRRGRRESALVKSYMKALRDSTVSLYEIIELDPGKSMKLRDLLQDDRTLTVQEKLVSENAALWDCFGARIVKVRGKNYFTLYIMHYSREVAEEIKAAIEGLIRTQKWQHLNRLRKQRRKLSAKLHLSRKEALKTLTSAPLFTYAWLYEQIVTSQVTLPDFRNTDEESIIFSEVRFPIVGDRADVIAALDEAADFERADKEAGWYWLESIDPDSEADSEFGELEFGYADLGPNVLVLSTSSAKRAELGQALLASMLGDLVGRSLVSFHHPFEMLGESAEKEISLTYEEMWETGQYTLDDFYHTTLDVPIPLLGDKTPREAAAAEKGRQQVIEWLEKMEKLERLRADLRNNEPYDLTWVWRELKIKPPRSR